MSPNLITGIFIEQEREKFETQRHRGEGHVKEKAEIRIMLPHKKAWSPQSRKQRAKNLPRAFRNSNTLSTPQFWLLTSKTVTGLISVILSYHACNTLL